ncbi:MAG: bacterioferritin [Thermoleophilaceae bacterium]|jgi:ferritin|nr:bacterioferritin [Thermoleophilaceae bacterium]
MPSERFIEELQAQVGREFAAAHQYTAIATHYDGQTYPRLARFFYKQADEERDHAMRMINYLIDAGAQPQLGEIAAPSVAFEDLVAPIRLAREQEQQVTVNIARLFEIARETRDYASESFMQWFVDEQVEEEASIQALLDVAERVREFPMMVEEFLARDGDSLGAREAG